VISLKSTKTIVYGEKSQRQNDVIFVNEGDFYAPPRDFKSEIIAINEINEIENVLLNNKTLPELLSYRDISLWWCIKNNVRTSCGISINFIIRFSKFLEEEKPEKIVIKEFNNFEIIEQICFKKNIKLEYSKSDYNKFKNSEKIRKNKNRNKLQTRITKLIENRKNIFNEKINKIPNIKNQTLFVVGSVFRRSIIDINKNETREGEFIVEDVVNLLEDKKNLVYLDYPSRFANIEESVTVLENRLKSKNKWFPIETLFSTSSNHINKNHFLKKYEELIETENFKKLFQFDGISYFNQLNKRNEFLYSIFPYWLNVIDSISDFFSIQKPKNVFLLAEVAPIPSIILSIAKKLKIKTIGIQHGIIFDYEPSYSNNKFADKKNPFWLPVPDKLLLFGDIPKQILIKKGFPSKNLVVFGNPLFFNLNRIKKFFEMKDLHKFYEIEPQKKVILFFSSGWHNTFQPVGKYEYDLMIWEQLLANFANKNEFVVILKLHHNEKPEPFQEILEKHNASNVRISDDNILEMIYLSSVVVSTFSTTIIDSLCFEKPVIQVIFDEAEFKNPFDEFKPVISSKLNELSKKILQAMDDIEMQKILFKNGNAFLKKYYNIYC